MRRTEKARRGQTIITEGSPDRSSHKAKRRQSITGKKMGGGPHDVSHSISGSTGTGDYNDTPPRRRRG